MTKQIRKQITVNPDFNIIIKRMAENDGTSEKEIINILLNLGFQHYDEYRTNKLKERRVFTQTILKGLDKLESEDNHDN